MNTTPTNNRSPLSALAAQANEALAPQARYNTTPTTRNGDGFYRGHGKPTDGAGQWQLVPGAKLPPRAFEVHQKERERYHLLARTLPMDKDPLRAVETAGRNIFDATFGAEQRKFENEIAAGQLELTRLAADHARLETDLEHVQATIIQEPPVPQLPPWFTLKWCAWASCLVCFGLSAAGAVSNIVFRLLPDTQALLPAVVVSMVWVLLSVASKIGIRAVRSPVREVLHWTIAGIGLLGAVLWLAGLVVSYASEINLNDVAATGVLSRSKAMPFVGQLLAEFAVGFACLSGMLSLVNHPRHEVPNPDRKVLSDHLAELNTATDSILRELANPQGNLNELNASRDALLAEGTAIISLRAADAALLAELQRQRDENQRLLGQFSARSNNSNHNYKHED
jgi:hypothetical protein